MQRRYQDIDQRRQHAGSLADSTPSLTITAINNAPLAAQVDTLTARNAVPGSVHSFILDGVTRSFTAGAADNNSTVAAAIAALINGDPLFSGRVIATAANDIVTVTARFAGYGFTLTGSANLERAAVTSNAAAAAIPFGRLVVRAGNAGRRALCQLASAAAGLVARVVELAPAAVDGAVYHVSLKIRGVSYHAEYKGQDGAALDIITDAGQGGELTWRCRLTGEFADNTSFAMIDPNANDAILSVEREGLHVRVNLGTNGVGDITSTAADIVNAITNDAEASELVTVEATGAGGVVTAAARQSFDAQVAVVGTPEDICNGLADNLNGQLPANTVLASVVGIGPDAVLRLTSALAGLDFDYGHGSDTIGVGFPVTTDNKSALTDVNTALLGISQYMHMYEMDANGVAQYPPNSTVSVIRRGSVFLELEDSPVAGNSVYVRLADAGNTGNPIGGFRCTQDQDNECVKLEGARVHEIATGGTRMAICEINFE